MADGPGYDVELRRRREGRTDYGKRLEMLKSGEHRAVVRMSNSHARVQLVQYRDDGDLTAVSAFSGQLEEYGWDHHCGNIPAAYLTGYLAATRAQEAGIDSAIVDLGLQERAEGGRYYAAVQGMRDAGLDVPADETVSPAEERIRGEHAAAHESDGMDETFEKVRENIEG